MQVRFRVLGVPRIPDPSDQIAPLDCVIDLESRRDTPSESIVSSERVVV